MEPRIRPRFAALALLCDLVAIDSVPGGWTADEWRLSERALVALRDLYLDIVAPPLEEHVNAALAASGVDPREVFMDEAEAVETVTRSDLIELVAGAALVRAEGVGLALLELANVPKLSRRASEHGIDCIGLHLDLDEHAAVWHARERVYLCSAKHTISSASDMCRKLIASIQGELTIEQATRSLRVFVDRLSAAGIDARRTYLSLVRFPDPNRVTIIGAGALALGNREEMLHALRSLPSILPQRRHVRVILVADIERLHERVA